MRGTKNIKEFANGIITMLSTYLDAQVARFYVFNDKDQTLDFCEGYAYNPELTVEPVKMGEGLRGQAAKYKMIICKDNIPSGYLDIYSENSSTQATSILIIPLIFDGGLSGMIELGSSSHFPKGDIEFASRIAEDIAISLKTIVGNALVNELLIESKKQTILLSENEEKLQVMNADLQQSNKYKSEFLANMSHEIRTPMNGVIGMTTLMLSTNLNVEQRNFAQTIQSSGDALLSIINDILDFSKIEAGKLDIEEIDFDIRSMMDDFAKTMAFKTEEKGLELICYADKDVPVFIKGDPGRLRQILTNLTGNAIKFTSVGEISVACKLDEYSGERIKLKFSIKDTGIGIHAEKHKLLFEQFTQADGSTTRNYGGTGLGLAISKQLSELMGGDIGVESVEGAGSEFWFTVCMRPSEKKVELAPIGDLKGARVLIVDDNKTNRDVLAGMLNGTGVDFEIAEDGHSALDLIRNTAQSKDKFDVALLDMQMPGMNGEELGAAIMADPDISDTRLVLLSSMGRRGDASRLKKNGFSGFLTKPVSQRDIHNSLAQVLGFNDGTTSTEADFVTRHSLHENKYGQMKILVVEDNVVNQKVAQGLLKKLGAACDVVGDGLEAIKALEMINYDLVFMDMQMPVMDGLEATEHIRSGRSKLVNNKVPIIAMTANAMEEDRRACLEAGMNDYMSKPIDVDKLSNMLQVWLKDETISPELEPEPKPEESIAVFDRKGFMERIGNDDELGQLVLNAFSGEAGILLSSLKDSILAKDMKTAERHAHSIKGAAANIGGERVRSLASDLEQSCLANNDQAIAQQIPLLEFSLAELLAEI